MKKSFLFAFSLLFAGKAFSWTEITSGFVPEFKRRAVQSYVDQPLMTFKSRCLVGLPGGGCLTVEKTKARGSLLITSMDYWTGKLFEQDMSDPITGTGGKAFASNLYFEFHYDGESQAELWKQDNFTGYAWESLHPTGRILVWLTANNDTSWKLTYSFEADPGHPDDPNRFMSEVVAPKLKPVLADHVRKILGIPNLIIL